ncbi:uncharacterized protein LOC123532064 [Mercenaria mercenaria]|uniref:uncharacterized protein LOC123532064 n=1 Tax=Mercenaria mercenaria TaxID=6596 RepID=UPI00234EEC46|nr:uncharacterized protein LOC123532064 [Mercenaria mercenaria]
MPVGGDKSNNFNDIDRIEKAEDSGDDWKVGYSNTAYQSEKPPLASTSSGAPSEHSSEPSDQPPPYESAVVPVSEKGKGIEALEDQDDDEKILNVLREIVRKCTLANPMKRPTAKEVLKMIEEVAPPELLSEKFNISDDEEEEEEEEDSMAKKIK